MTGELPIDRIPLWLLFVASVGIVIVPMEIGYRLGALMWRRPIHENEKAASSMVAPVLGLLGFMLAFTFGIAQSHFDDRRQAMFASTDAISTASQRADFAAEPERSAIRRLLREEVEVNLAVAHRKETLDAAIRRVGLMHDTLWLSVRATTMRGPPTALMGLLVQSVNDVIDTSERRVNATIRGRVHIAIWAVLCVITTLGMALVGYDSGLSGSRRSPAMLPLAFAFAAVMFLIADLDRPLEGWMHVSQAPLEQLYETLNSR